jgi:hypothetical protein
MRKTFLEGAEINPVIRLLNDEIRNQNAERMTKLE